MDFTKIQKCLKDIAWLYDLKDEDFKTAINDTCHLLDVLMEIGADRTDALIPAMAEYLDLFPVDEDLLNQSEEDLP